MNDNRFYFLVFVGIVLLICFALAWNNKGN